MLFAAVSHSPAAKIKKGREPAIRLLTLTEKTA
jgi:hypothetical protein